MAHALTPVDTYTAAVTVPDDGDVHSAASVETPFQALTNRVHHCRTRSIESVGGVEPLALGAAITSTRFLAGGGMHTASTTAPWSQNDVTDAGLLSIPIPSKIGCQMTQIELRVTGLYTAGAHAGNVATMPQFELWSLNNTTGAATLIDTEVDPTTVAGGTYELMHSITMAGLVASFASNLTYYLIVHGENGANKAADKFAVYAALITYAAV